MDSTSLCLGALLGLVALAVVVGLIAMAFVPRKDDRIDTVHSMALRYLEEHLQQSK